MTTTKTQTKETPAKEVSLEVKTLFDFTKLDTPEKALGQVMKQANFDLLLSKIVKTANTTADCIHEAALCALVQAFAHDNFDYMTKLYKSIQSKTKNGQNMTKQLVLWLETYSPAQMRTTKAGKAFRKDKSETANSFDFIEAMKNPWYTIELLTEEEAAIKSYGVKELEAAILSLIKKAEGAIEGKGKFQTPQEQLEATKARVQAIKSSLDAVIPLSNDNNDDNEENTEEQEAA